MVCFRFSWVKVCILCIYLRLVSWMVWHILKECIGGPWWYMISYGLGDTITCLRHTLGTQCMVVMVHCNRHIFVILTYTLGLSYGTWHDSEWYGIWLRHLLWCMVVTWYGIGLVHGMVLMYMVDVYYSHIVWYMIWYMIDVHGWHMVWYMVWCWCECTCLIHSMVHDWYTLYMVDGWGIWYRLRCMVDA